MSKESIANGFIIDLASAKDTSQLVSELNTIMEHPDVAGKRIYLKLGSIDLKQSQLLSIKALIETMDAELAYIETASEQASASAISLGIEVTASVKDMKDEEEQKLDKSVDENDIEEVVEQETNISGDNAEAINTLEGVEDVYTEESAEVISEIIQSETLNSDFETLATHEGIFNKEDSNKYILLDTADVELNSTEENSIDTKTLPTLYIQQNLRSGQTVNYQGNILILGDAHPGSEIVAAGDITVWGILGGIAHAGSEGNITAKVRALKLNAIQLRIAGLYARRNDTLNVPYVQKTNEFTPEEAQIENGRIVIYKKLRRD